MDRSDFDQDCWLSGEPVGLRLLEIPDYAERTCRRLRAGRRARTLRRVRRYLILLSLFLFLCTLVPMAGVPYFLAGGALAWVVGEWGRCNPCAPAPGVL